MFPCYRVVDRQTVKRMSLIMNGYNKIRGTIHSNAIVMRETNIQLPFLNQRTLQAW
ncbi:hypothetical protein DPMN_121476 [Dreissena polymorpha]|nr:hypothetical protein DPMN_121476 [Dreissena polymorpha]